MHFGEALNLLKAGWRVFRAGWVDQIQNPNVWLILQPHEPAPIRMRSFDGALVPWMADHTDMLATDWTIVTPDPTPNFSPAALAALQAAGLMGDDDISWRDDLESLRYRVFPPEKLLEYRVACMQQRTGPEHQQGWREYVDALTQVLADSEAKAGIPSEALTPISVEDVESLLAQGRDLQDKLAPRIDRMRGSTEDGPLSVEDRLSRLEDEIREMKRRACHASRSENP